MNTPGLPGLQLTLRQALAEHGGVRLAILFGSQATRHATLLSRHLFDAADFLPYRNRILAERRQAWIGR